MNSSRTRFYQLILVFTYLGTLTLNSSFGDVIKSPSRKKPATLKAWFNQLHAIVREKSQIEPRNDTEKKQFRDELVDEIKKQRDKSVFYFKTKVKNVKWKDGIASIYTEDELKLIRVRPEATTLKAKRSQPFEVLVSHQEAAAIRPGAILRVEAEVVFHKDRFPQTNRTHKAQVLYGLAYSRLGAGYLGVFTTNSYKISVDKTELKSRWNLVEKELKK